MDIAQRIERSIEQTISRARAPGSPPKLGQAMQYAVFPGGARIRPKLCLSVALTCGDDNPAMADAAATAIELLHCASLVHDDLPCFDDAEMRRGKPSVHRAHGEPVAVLAGDALIILAFEILARRIPDNPERAATLLRIITGAVGMPFGITAGQAWESEDGAILADYQRAKTGSLFAAATAAGGAAAGADASLWQTLGERLGEAYQVADDIADVIGDPDLLGKPTGQDATFGRPNAVAAHGMDGAAKRLTTLIVEAIDSIPPSPGQAVLRQQILQESRRFMPKGMAIEIPVSAL
ncbi:MAG: geranylgeranyl pyrophosphate synthase [Rhodospirillaceae bacterium]|jgi:geranylgeranyl diphosphate synthase type II|uniref:polyprenyl synthetase family protein n=1 Tax=unclassified Hwanghaeella TaxID=2605944 RepID=UPI000C5797F7|nr:geranylgeranyl pyrophosphate synthase [Rhodospirillales bacterium]MAX46737.1 geranylgeranyl pyrophosphate synthase [Rhodospirillaceae bacterium]|tara:strand:- start:689 stop:1570 length:882 start_codon:yes stop_codon:yes gene_type:complete